MKKENEVIDDLTIISKGVNIEGKVISNGNVRLDGKVKGDLIVGGDLTCGETSEVQGTVKSENIIVNGKMEGTINAKNKLTLKIRAHLTGDIFAKILVIEEGAKFDGKSQMSNASYDPSKTSAPGQPSMNEKK